eukprot:m.133604 g.133604  ORF g.133604 m.133604 type:complete len:432 (+) comp22501_c0_seq8:164-1459(+)
MALRAVAQSPGLVHRSLSILSRPDGGAIGAPPLHTAPGQRRQLHFEVLHQSRVSRARVGRIHLDTGRTIDTPTFVPVATTGAIRGIGMATPAVDQVPLVFCNTLHLMMQPGADTVAAAGGLHSFTGRKNAIITDSGGFQIFSLAAGEMDLGGADNGLKGAGQRKRPSLIHKISEDGVVVRSYLGGGELYHLSPESSVAFQKKLGGDIIVPLDEVVPFNADAHKVHQAFRRSHRWQYRSLREHQSNPQNQAIYGVVHGGTDVALRRWSARYIAALPFDGVAVGGSLGKNRDEMIKMLDAFTPCLGTDRPKHLLGIGDAESIQAALPMGFDSFDSCYPTRLARHGSAVVLAPGGEYSASKVDMQKAVHAENFAESVGGDGCGCTTCATCSRAYLRHLFKAGEHAAGSLLTTHNIFAMAELMKRAAREITNDRL